MVVFAVFDSEVDFACHAHGMHTDNKTDVPLGVIAPIGEDNVNAKTWVWRGKKSEYASYERWFTRVKAESKRRKRV